MSSGFLSVGAWADFSNFALFYKKSRGTLKENRGFFLSTIQTSTTGFR
jgi:hypothetical protein